MSGGIGGGEGEGFDLSVKGQVHGYDTAQAAVNVGANDTIIYADSAQAAGIGYGASAKSTLGTTGDILAASSANTLSALTASATSGHVLTSTGAGSLPTYQAVVAGGGQVELIDTYNSGTTDANTHNFTFAAPYINLGSVGGTDPTYSELWVVINLWGWHYTIGEVEMQIASNGGAILTTGYSSSFGYELDGTTMTQLVDSGGSSLILANANTNVASTGLNIHARLTMMGSGGGFYSNLLCEASCTGDGGIPARKANWYESSIGLGSSGHYLSGITINSGGNWDDNSTMSVYGVKWS